MASELCIRTVVLSKIHLPHLLTCLCVAFDWLSGQQQCYPKLSTYPLGLAVHSRAGASSPRTPPSTSHPPEQRGFLTSAYIWQHSTTVTAGLTTRNEQVSESLPLKSRGEFVPKEGILNKSNSQSTLKPFKQKEWISIPSSIPSSSIPQYYGTNGSV